MITKSKQFAVIVTNGDRVTIYFLQRLTDNLTPMLKTRLASFIAGKCDPDVAISLLAMAGALQISATASRLSCNA